jgi:carbon monoxide dehydrogenase subunit G
MVWIRSGTTKSVRVRASLDRVRGLLLDVERAGMLMPGVTSLTNVGGSVHHYALDPITNGAVHLVPDYESTFDTADAGNITWEPHGEHNFRSWGRFTTTESGVEGEVVLEISTRSEASVEVAPIMVTLIEPFAQMQTDQITTGFLDRLRDELESVAVST